MRFCTYTSVTLKNGDVCTVGDWVLVQSNATNPAVCRIEELLSPLLSDGKIPQYASAILVQHAVLTEVAEVYHMPRVRLVQDEFFLQPLTVGTQKPLKQKCNAYLQPGCVLCSKSAT